MSAADFIPQWQKDLGKHQPLQGATRNIWGDHTQVLLHRGPEAVVTAMLDHPREKFHEEGDLKHYGEDSDGVGHDMGRRTTEFGMPMPHVQGALWSHEYSLPKISELYANKGGRGDVGTALGVLAAHSVKHFGQIPQAETEDLSAHSIPVVRKAQASLGLPFTRPRRANGITRDDGANRAGYEYNRIKEAAKTPRTRTDVTPLSQAEINTGRNISRSIFAGGKHRALGKQFEQPELPT